MQRIIGIVAGILIQFSLFSQTVEIREPIRFLALGDSYTVGQSVADSLSWPRQLYDSLEAEGFSIEELQIIARTGWRTDNLATAIYDARLREDYNLVSLLIGVNDQYQGVPVNNYPAAFTDLLETAIDLAEGRISGVFVLSIPDYAYTPFGGGNSYISNDIDAYNEINRSITADYGIRYFDITPISRQGLEQPGLVARDGLHPSGAMYSLWVAEIMEHIRIHNSPAYPNNLAEENYADLNVYPNPAQNYIRIQSAVMIERIQIIDLNGRLKAVQEQGNQVDVSHLHAGMYLLKVCTGEHVYMGKFIKEFE